MRGKGVVSKTVDTKMLQTVIRNSNISFGKVVSHDQLSNLVVNRINHVAMITNGIYLKKCTVLN